MSLRRLFWGDRRGNVATIFALALVPVFGAMGAAVDYSRAGSARSALQAALDSTALALSKTAMELSQSEFQKMGSDYFNSVFDHAAARDAHATPTFVKDGGTFTVRVDGSAKVDTLLARMIGRDEMEISTFAEVIWGMKRLELALVLDVTGSMANQGRMTELKKATNTLLDTLKKAAQRPEDVNVAIVPFAAHVNIGTGNVNQSWLDWSDWIAEPAYMTTWLSNSSNQRSWDLTGPGETCPFTSSGTGNPGFRCSNGLAGTSNDSVMSASWTIPTTGANAGLICPSRDTGGRDSTLIGKYHAGCYNSVEKPHSTRFSEWYPVRTGSNASCGSLNSNQCECSGSGANRVCVMNPGLNWPSNAGGSTSSCGSLSSSQCRCVSNVCRQKAYDHTWRPAPKSAWAGCVRDRNQSHDVSDSTPATVSTSTTLTNVNGSNESYRRLTNPNAATTNAFQPVQNLYCPTAALQPLTNNWDTLTSRVASLDSWGATNITIGLAWGWHALFNNQPLTQAEEPKPDELDKVIILMTDGDNTLNRWNGNGSSSCANCDTRTRQACTNAKAAGIKLYTVRLMDGNESLLEACASEKRMYYNVETATQLNATFSAIAQNLANLRISK